MWKRATGIVVGAVVATAVLGTGVAVAMDDGAAVTPAAATSTAAPAGDGAAKKVDRPSARKVLERLKGIEHATWVTAKKGGGFETHQAIKGTVTAVSATSVTVKAADGVSQTYKVTGDTKVRVHKEGAKPADGAVTDVTAGRKVLVIGVGTGTPTAERILVSAG